MPEDHCVRKIEGFERVSVVVGDGHGGFAGDGGPAARARLYEPRGLAFDRAGTLYVSEMNRIRKVSARGTITTVGWFGTDSFREVNGRLITLTPGRPVGLLTRPDGEVLVADDGENQVRQIGGSGIAMELGRRSETRGPFTTVVGNGQWGHSGDGGPALRAELSPTSLALDDQGRLLITDWDNHYLRRVDGRGIITSVAGTGSMGLSGDGGPAAAAELCWPMAVAADGRGNVFIADCGNFRVRRIDANGIITTRVVYRHRF